METLNASSYSINHQKNSESKSSNNSEMSLAYSFNDDEY